MSYPVWTNRGVRHECLGLGVDRPQRAVDLLGVGIFDLHLDMAVHG